MIESLASLSFLYPWVLSGFALLPVIWFILRIMPPSPRTVNFAPARFLEGLVPDNQSHAHTPWWIMAIRMLILGLILTALAGPIINRDDSIPETDAVRIIIDNSWASGPSWEIQKAKATEIAKRAGRDNKPIYILTTANAPGQKNISSHGPITQTNALNIIKALDFMPWEADYVQTGTLIRKTDLSGQSVYSFILSNGVNASTDKSSFIEMVKAAQNKGGAALLTTTPKDTNIAILQKDPKSPLSEVHAQIVRPDMASEQEYVAEVLGNGGQVLDRITLTIEENRIKQRIEFDVPPVLKNKIQKIQITAQNHAASVLVFDDQNKKRDVGIVSTGSSESGSTLSDSKFYLEKALAPYHNLEVGTVSKLIENKVAVIIMADISALPAEDLDEVENWIKAGGVLLRFAGPNSAANPPILSPVELRRGERALEGQLTWDKPLRIQPFPETSPLYGVDVPKEITINRQILTDSNAPQKAQYWATLEDGTPLITAAENGDGLMVLVHVTASPEWSNLALSGLYVQILRRIVNLAGKSDAIKPNQGDLQPLLMLTGSGKTVKPQGYENPLPAIDIADARVSSFNPPGLYGRANVLYAFNLGERLSSLAYTPDAPLGVSKLNYELGTENNLMPKLLIAAFILFIADWVIMTILQILWKFNIGFSRVIKVKASTAAAIGITLMLIFTSAPANAQGNYTDRQLEQWSVYANGLYMGYVPTGNSVVDSTTQKGLEALAQVLKQRTSAEPDGVVAVDLEQGYLPLLPFIYWPIGDEDKTISTRALQNVQHYLDHGGTILFDTRDQISTPSQGFSAGIGRRSQQLRTMLGSLNVPSLQPIPDDHVLGRTFYLLDDFQGRYSGGTLWVESQSASGRDGVSSVLIGGNDWASAWASARVTQTGYVSTNTRSEEMAIRFGVNIMMYALTGNYKDDQVHLPHILERLGQ